MTTTLKIGIYKSGPAFLFPQPNDELGQLLDKFTEWLAGLSVTCGTKSICAMPGGRCGPWDLYTGCPGTCYVGIDLTFDPASNTPVPEEEAYQAIMLWEKLVLSYNAQLGEYSICVVSMAEDTWPT